MSPYDTLGQQTTAVNPVAFSQPNWEQILKINWAQRLDYINYKIWTIENALSSRELNGIIFPSTRVEELLQLLGRWLSKGYHDASRSSGCCCWTRGAVGLQGVTVDPSFVHGRNLHGNQESTKSQWKKYNLSANISKLQAAHYFEQGFWFLHLCTSGNSCHTYRQRYDLRPLPTCKKNNWIHRETTKLNVEINNLSICFSEWCYPLAKK